MIELEKQINELAQPDRSRKHLLPLTLTLIAAFSLLILGWLSWEAYYDYRYIEAQLPKIARMEIVRAKIVYLDEVLTMSARMAAASGDLDWEARYRRFEQQLDQSLEEALRLDPNPSHGAAAAQIDAANVALVAMEDRAFELVREGKNAEAQRLLSSGVYENHKTVYSAGLTEFNRRLSQAIDSTRAELRADMRRSAITTIASAVLLILGALFVFRATRRWQAVIVESNQRLNQKTAELGEMNIQLGEMNIQVGNSVVEIAETAKEHRTTANEVATATAKIGATSREISATSRELVKTMIEVATVAGETAELAGSGQAGLARREDTMRHVMEAAVSINAKLAVLNEKAGNINQVVTTITKVADQTNLLSLNAAIEAEKAGEYGRGFSVVATEIRRLADQTAVATYDIEQMVKEIQAAVSAGVMGMDKFSEEVRRGMYEVQQAGGQLTQIIQQVQAVTPRFESVNEGMQAQATGAEQISQALTQLSEAAWQTVESLDQSNRAIDELSQVSIGLRSETRRAS